ncbi:MAG: endonuclease III [Synergistaceae bacterium]|nr:endonuclease III [Synergistaceae bacterium]
MNLITEILDALESQYHNEQYPPKLGHNEPLDGLILTVLSQNTNDINRDRAYENLKAKFPTWPDVIIAGKSQLEDSIRTAGLAHTKAGRIITILERVKSDFGDYSIRELAAHDREYIRKYLRALPGVGAKTVACTLLFDFGIPAFPVDTHITRISKRVGIAPEKFSPEEISLMLEDVVPESRCLGGHVNMIAHGRAVCHSQKPECNSCVLSKICNYRRNNYA